MGVSAKVLKIFAMSSKPAAGSNAFECIDTLAKRTAESMQDGIESGSDVGFATPKVPAAKQQAVSHAEIGSEASELALSPCEVKGGISDNKEKCIATQMSQASEWDGPEDPQNPQNWTNRRKWSILLLMSFTTFNQAMSSTIFAPGVPEAMQEFGSHSGVISSLLVSIYVIGLALGPLILSPLSEMYGRVPIVHFTNVLFVVGAAACASSVNIPMLLVFRLVMGASTVSLGGAYVADMMLPEDRPRAMNVWTLGPVLAPVVGPIVGGYVCQYASWRWTFAIVGIIGVVSAIVCVPLPETYAPRLLRKRAKQRSADATASTRDLPQLEPRLTGALAQRLFRPFVLLACSPLIGITSVALAIAYSYMYLMFTTFTGVFETGYDFNTGEAGLAYLGLGIGCLLGQYALDIIEVLKRKNDREKGRAQRPEARLRLLVYGSLMLSAGLLWYGWSAAYRVHWIVPLLGTGVCGAGIMFFFLAVQTYIVEVYTVHAASALAASSLVRCIFGTTVPLAGPRLYESLGLGWGNTVLAACSLTVLPTTWYLDRYGASLREKVAKDGSRV